ncbi:MAG: transposase domain-containing protein [Pseudomonadota bacterium]
MRGAPDQEWWSAQEIADKALPGVPSTKRRVNAMADREGWQGHPKLARKRRGRGGGWEYHWTLFPVLAQRKLLSEQTVSTDHPEPIERGDAWHAFEGLPARAKKTAETRLDALDKVARFERGGLSRTQAVAEVASLLELGSRSIWNWFEMVEGVAVEDRLAYLAPRHRRGARKTRRAECDAAFWEMLKGDFLRLGGPPFRQCYDNACEIANTKGWANLTYRTALRRMESDVPSVVRVFKREGEAGLQKAFPPMIRDRSGMVAMEGVNADCHKIDVFVEWPDGTINRPQIIAFQDLYSGKILSWRVDHDPNKVAVMSAFGEMVETYGIPRHCTFDNGREFANKWLTGGAPTRFRFKIRDDDPLGVLPMLGIELHWARPGHGQAKPIERAFRELATRVAQDPRFDGAYVGNRPDAKPENYGSRAIPADKFLEVLDQGIVAHNAREGRLSDTAKGRSFDETFAESFQAAPIRQATSEQRRLWLMAQEVRKLHARHGAVKLFDNGYYSDWMGEHAGRKVVLRFDPEHLHEGLHVYDLDGAYLGFAACREKVGFYDVASAREAAKLDRQRRKLVRQLAETEVSIKPDQVAAHLDEIRALRDEAPEPLVAKVVQPEFGARPRQPLVKRPVYSPPIDAAEDAARDAFIAEFTPKAQPLADTDVERFKRALEIEARSEAGKRVGEAEAEWLRGYQTTSEYRSRKALWEQFGDEAIG